LRYSIELAICAGVVPTWSLQTREGAPHLVLANAAAEDDHAGLFGGHGHAVEAADVGDDVYDEGDGGFVGVGEDHVAEGAVGQSGAEDGDLILCAASRSPT
jgi:hypothetical protein